MSSNKISLHSEGVSKVTNDSNRQIVSIGGDTSVVFFNQSIEGDSYQFNVEEDGVDNLKDIVCYHRNNVHYVAVATNKHNVLEYSYASGNPNDDPFTESCFQRILLRFTSDINCQDVSLDNQYLAAGGSDFLIKVVNLDNEGAILTLEGHEGPVLCVHFNNSLLASSSCDGSVRVWSFKDKTQLCCIKCIPRAIDISLCSTLARFAWNSNHNVLAIPTGVNVDLYTSKANSDSNSSWTLLKKLQHVYHEMSINASCWSPCGGYLALGGADGRVTIWSYPSCTLLHKIDCDVTMLCSFSWDPSGSDSAHPITFATSSGFIGSIPNGSVYGEGTGDIDMNGSGNINARGSDNDISDLMMDEDLLMEGIPADSIFEDDDDLLNATADGTSSRKRHASSSMDKAPPTSKIRHPSNESGPYDPYDNDDDVLGGDDAESVGVSVEQGKEADSHSVPAVPVTPVPVTPVSVSQEYHEIFQPSATPTHLHHRFMVYNVVGVVRCHGDYDSTPMIEVEFHDVSVHHSFSINNNNGWTMAALNSKGIVLATEKNERGPSQFQVTVFDSWDIDKDWSCFMPKGESIDVVAMGDGWVAIGTDKQFIRIYSLGGIQREIICSPGQLVTLSGCGSYLGVVYQETEASLLSYWLLDIHNHTVVSRPHTLPLSAKAKLEWIGFSDQGLPLSYDSKGMIRTLSSQYGRSSWIPVIDCHKTLAIKSDHYFVVGMTHDPILLRVILCKGMDYPPVHPRPVMTALPLSLPLCDHETEKSEIESRYIQTTFIQPPLGDTPTQTAALQYLMEMLALACQSDLEYRGYEVASMINDDQGIGLALQYASQSGHYRLARHIGRLREQLAQQRQHQYQQEQHDYDDDDDSYQPTILASSNHGNRYDDIPGTESRRMSKINSSGRSLVVSRRSAPKQAKNNVHSNSSNTSPDRGDYGDHGDNDDRGDNDDCGDYVDNGMGLDEDETSIDVIDGGDDTVASDGLHNDENTDTTNGYSANDTTLNTSSHSLGGDIASQALTPSASIKSNPFKITTPVSKKIQVERQSSFLEKLCKTVVEEEEEKKKKKEKSIKGFESSSVKKKPVKAKKKENAKLTSFVFNKKE